MSIKKRILVLSMMTVQSLLSMDSPSGLPVVLLSVPAMAAIGLWNRSHKQFVPVIPAQSDDSDDATVKEHSDRSTPLLDSSNKRVEQEVFNNVLVLSLDSAAQSDSSEDSDSEPASTILLRQHAIEGNVVCEAQHMDIQPHLGDQVFHEASSHESQNDGGIFLEGQSNENQLASVQEVHEEEKITDL